MKQTKEQLREEIEMLIAELEQAQTDLIYSIKSELDEIPDTKVELKELQKDVQTELDNQHDIFVRI